MGLMDLFSNMAEWDPRDLEAGGILGASMMAKARKQSEEKARRPKPGVFCNKVCVIDDSRCTPCLALQEELGELLVQLEKMEEMAELPSEQVQQLSQRKKITKCSLCGAAFENGNKSCPYCGTPYPEDGINFDVPLSRQERKTQLLNKAEEAWNSYLKFFVLNNEYMKETAGSDWMGKIQKFVGGAGNMLQGQMKHNASELQQGADYYGVPLSRYIHGVAVGEMKAMKVLRYEEMSKQLNAQQQQRNAEFQRQQAQRAAQNPSYTAMDFLQRKYSDPRNAPQYRGSADDCSNCLYWESSRDYCTVRHETRYHFNVCERHYRKS